jgi:hypothetical protein
VIPKEMLAAAQAGATGQDGESLPATTSVRPGVDKRSVRLRTDSDQARRPANGGGRDGGGDPGDGS